MNFVLYPLLFLILVDPAQSAETGPLTLSEFLIQVETGNPSLQASRQRAQAQENRIRPAATVDDPFFAAGPDEIAFGDPASSMILYQLSQSVPFPGKLGSRARQVQAEASALRADAETTRRELLVGATQTYWRAIYNQYSIELNRRIQKLLSGTIQSSKARYRTGEASHHEWLLARAELAILDVEHLRLKRDENTLFALMNELRYQVIDVPIDLAKVDFKNLEKNSVQEPLLAEQPELRALNSNVEVAEAQKHFASLSYFPDFVFQGMLMNPGGPMMEEPKRWSIMVGINLPIFFFRKQSDLNAAAELARDAAQSERRSLENRLKTELTEAKRQLKTAQDVVALYEKEVIPATNMAAENAKSGYTARRVPLADLLDTFRTQRTQELELLAARIDVELAKTRLQYLLSSPPVLRLAPMRPTLFGGAMGSGDTAMDKMGNDSVNIGRGVRGGGSSQDASGQDGSDGGGMSEMGGM